MSDGWVIFGYAVTYGILAAYAARLLFRIRYLRRSLPPRP